MDVLEGMLEHHLSLVADIIDRTEHVSDDVLDRPIDLSVEGIDRDPFDAWCEHMLVTEEDTGEVVGTYRILTGRRPSASADSIPTRSSI